MIFNTFNHCEHMFNENFELIRYVLTARIKGETSLCGGMLEMVEYTHYLLNFHLEVFIN